MTTTLTNASLADAVALFLAPETNPTSAILAPSTPPVAPRPHVASRPARPFVTSLFEASDPAVSEQIDSAFARLECGTRS